MNKLILALIVLVVGALVGWYMLGGGLGLNQPTLPLFPKKSVEETPKVVEDEGMPKGGGEDTSLMGDLSGPVTEKGGVAARTVVTYSGSGFLPAAVTVSVGDTVSFMNESEKGMWVASDPHPSHSILPGFDAKKSVVKGGSYEYTFVSVGTWKYHNHLAPSDTAIVVVVK